ncbi:MAG TPA: 3-deoxy-manno-octulosonate cytidylyltransferase [Candidatus Methanoperedens sp.]|nr:3-deoxy-manno-octulosonate cytidylyltransferase [Candidatus Methanoperedens sp.]
MRVVIGIPARIGSTRLPGKALADIAGEPMCVRVWRRCARVRGVARVLVATDDERIAAVVRAAGGEAVLTAEHASGTDRIASAVRGDPCDLVVNVQGDEPFLESATVEALIASFDGAAAQEAATLAAPVRGADELYQPSVVKVLIGRDGYAVCFSRQPLPWREGLWEVVPEGWRRPVPPPNTAGYLRHIGMYAYRAAFLQRLTRLEPTPGELAERLEQLRILEHGHRIRVVVVGEAGLAVDTPADLAEARRRAARETA